MEFCKTVTPAELEGTEFEDSTIIKGLTEEEYIALCFVDSSLNFCYWGEPKWTIQVDGADWDGSAAMIRAIKQAVENDYPLLSADYLATIPLADLGTIFKGNVTIPLFNERLEILRALGRITKEKFGGQFSNIVQAANWDSLALIDLIVRDFPTVFDDAVNYHGHKVGLYKRAQLLPVQLHDLHGLGLVGRQINGFASVTAMADYKIPQALRKFGILEYTTELAGKVDNLVELPEGSEEEVEIRAMTIWACELIAGELNKRMPDVYAARVGVLFWWKGQVKSPDDKPYHRTRTVWY